MRRPCFLVLFGGAVLAASVACSPLHEVRQILNSPAGQKLVDRMVFEGDADFTDPGVEFYLIQGAGVRSFGARYRAEVKASGELTEDEKSGETPAIEATDGFDDHQDSP